MFRHKDRTRTLRDNLRIASFLSMVAGIVNVAGFLAVQKLTTNVTGHFAFFVDEVFQVNFLKALVYFLYIFFFFLGSFISNLLVELIAKVNTKIIYRIPIMIESVVLISVAVMGQQLIKETPNILAFMLLFAMGLQNSLVTTISHATVRTTHLTGLFTDLGIELSQLFFHKEHEHRVKLFSSIKLRLTIISFFFLGGLVGGVFYASIQLHVLFLAAAILGIGLFYDYLKLNLAIRAKKRIRKVISNRTLKST